jgi:hypothetical protein
MPAAQQINWLYTEATVITTNTDNYRSTECKQTTQIWYLQRNDTITFRINSLITLSYTGKVIPLHAMEALGVRGGLAPTHS